MPPNNRHNADKQHKAELKSLSDLFDRLATNGLVPPQSVDVERSVLGAMMISKSAAVNVMQILGTPKFEEMPFYLEQHRWIYRAILTLDEKRLPIDLLSVTNQLRYDGKLDLVGGPMYLVDLTSTVVTTANVETHCYILLEKHIQRELIRTCEEIKLRTFLGEEDPFDLLDKADSDISKISDIRYHRRGLEDIQQRSNDAIEHLERQASRGQGVTGITSGLREVDELTAGFQEGDLIILAARPSMGKTAMMLNIAWAATSNKDKSKRAFVLIYSLEMDAVKLMLRLICAIAEIDMQSVRKNELTDADWKKIRNAILQLKDVPIFIDDTRGITVQDIRAKTRRKVQEIRSDNDYSPTMPGLVFVDYLQLLRYGGREFQNREREMTEIGQSLKNLAGELKLTVLPLAQLNREVDKRKDNRPMDSDLRESGSLEQIADMIVFLYRPEKYGIFTDPEGKVDYRGLLLFILSKQRSGPIGDVKLKFIGAYQKIVDHSIFDGIKDSQVGMEFEDIDVEEVGKDPF